MWKGRENDLTSGRLLPAMARFSIPCLLACFLQTFYGMADLFITGQFSGAAAITAVSVGSQVMHMLTVVTVGLSMGTSVLLGQAAGARDPRLAGRSVGSSFAVFSFFGAAVTAALMLLSGIIPIWLDVPREALAQTRGYLQICFAGIPFIMAYNLISSIYRGLGDTKRALVFVAAAGAVNIVLDYLLIGVFHMGAQGAAAATVFSQGVSVVLASVSLYRFFALTEKRQEYAVLRRDMLCADRQMLSRLLSVGLPIACQDGLIQLSFLVITAIANSRGVNAAAAVGITEKIISFLFLVPSAMLSTVAAAAAQNIGAGRQERGRAALRYGIAVCVVFGTAVFVFCQFFSLSVMKLFTGEPEVLRLGEGYLRVYALDCVFAGIHFCYSGYFSACGKSLFSFLHNMISIAAVRIPGAYLASVFFPETLCPMGLAAPAGSLLSALICTVLFLRTDLSGTRRSAV